MSTSVAQRTATVGRGAALGSASVSSRSSKPLPRPSTRIYDASQTSSSASSNSRLNLSPPSIRWNSNWRRTTAMNLDPPRQLLPPPPPNLTRSQGVFYSSPPSSMIFRQVPKWSPRPPVSSTGTTSDRVFVPPVRTQPSPLRAQELDSLRSRSDPNLHVTQWLQNLSRPLPPIPSPTKLHSFLNFDPGKPFSSPFAHDLRKSPNVPLSMRKLLPSGGDFLNSHLLSFFGSEAATHPPVSEMRIVYNYQDPSFPSSWKSFFVEPLAKSGRDKVWVEDVLNAIWDHFLQPMPWKQYIEVQQVSRNSIDAAFSARTGEGPVTPYNYCKIQLVDALGESVLFAGLRRSLRDIRTWELVLMQSSNGRPR